MANKKYAKFLDPDFEVKTFRWPYWLLPLLFVSLLLVLGLFIFITIHSADSFGCFFYCEQKIDDGGLVPPDVDHLMAENATESPTKHERKEEKSTEEYLSPLLHQKKAKKNEKVQITISGKILFPKDNTPKVLRNNSYIKIALEDTTMMDVSSVEICSQEFRVDKSYRKADGLKYEMKCSKPPMHRWYSLSAVLNVGWRRDAENSIRKGDYLTDTNIEVQIKDNKITYEQDIHLVHYG